MTTSDPSDRGEDAPPERVMLPDIERAIDLAMKAWNEDGGQGAQVLGWASSSVLYHAQGERPEVLEFGVTPRPRRSHEDEVILIAFRPPHPEIWTLDEVVNGCLHRNGTEDRWVGSESYECCRDCGLLNWEEGERG